MTTTTEHGTFWVCVDCMIEHANGESPVDPDPAQPQPWALWTDSPEHITMGMLYTEHSCDDPEDGSTECDCETREFTWSDCDGCGSKLAGSRHAFTWWAQVTPAHALNPDPTFSSHSNPDPTFSSHSNPDTSNATKGATMLNPDTLVYVVNHAMPGYLPESEPALFLDPDAARSYLADELDRLADYLADGPETDDDEITYVSAMVGIVKNDPEGDVRYAIARGGFSVDVETENTRYYIERYPLGALGIDPDSDAYADLEDQGA